MQVVTEVFVDQSFCSIVPDKLEIVFRMRVVLIILLVCSALGLSGAGFLLLKNRNSGSAVKEIPKTYVIVPKNDLPRGHMVIPGDLAWIEWPSESANNFISSKIKDETLLSKYNGRVTLSEISINSPILEKNFIAKDAVGGLVSLLLQPGKRAYTIAVSIDSGGAGFIVPGDYVDIILIQNLRDKLPRSNTNAAPSKLTDKILNAAAETLLQNVKVLAVGNKTHVARTSSDKEVTPVETITVEVTQRESEKIALAKTLGSLSVVLRSLTIGINANSSGFVADTTTSKALDEVIQEVQKNIDEGPSPGSANAGSTKKKAIKIYSGRNVIEKNVSPR